jgi:hypothetical protein
MRLVLSLVCALAGCKSMADDYKIIGNGGDDTIIGHQDAFVADGNDASAGTILGRACKLIDSRNLTDCAATGASGLTVTLGAAIALAPTTNDGSFSILDPGGSVRFWHVTGPATGTLFQTSTQSLDTGTQIPVFQQDTYTSLVAANIGTDLLDQQGSIFLHVVHAAGLNASGATATTSDLTLVPFYDATTANNWDQGTVTGTGAFGMIWVPAIAVGAATVTVTFATVPQVIPVTVENQTITWVEVAVP